VKGPPPQPSIPPCDLDIPIALHKGKQSCTDHLISHFVSYDHLNLSFCQFVMSLSFISIPKSYEKVILVPDWKQVMDEKMEALISRRTWELIFAPTNALVVGCRWVYTLKYLPDGSVYQYKARLVAKCYTQTYGVDYFDSPFARLNPIRILFSIVVNLS